MPAVASRLFTRLSRTPWAAYHLLLLPVLSQAPTEPLLQAEVGEAPARACAFKPGQRRNEGGKDAIASPDKQSIAASLATLVLTLPALRECRQLQRVAALHWSHGTVSGICNTRRCPICSLQGRG